MLTVLPMEIRNEVWFQLDVVLSSEDLKCEVLNDPEPLVPKDKYHPCLTVNLSLQYKPDRVVLNN